MGPVRMVVGNEVSKVVYRATLVGNEVIMEECRVNVIDIRVCHISQSKSSLSRKMQYNDSGKRGQSGGMHGTISRKWVSEDVCWVTVV